MTVQKLVRKILDTGRNRASLWEDGKVHKLKRNLKLEFIKFVYYIMGDHLILTFSLQVDSTFLQ